MIDSIETTKFKAQIIDAQITTLDIFIQNTWHEIPLKQHLSSLFINDIPLNFQYNKKQHAYCANYNKLNIELFYSCGDHNQLEINLSIKNTSHSAFIPHRISFALPFNCDIHDPNTTNTLYPTMLRCEKTHLWGYFQSSNGLILTLATNAPVASYTLEYEQSKPKITGAFLDLIHEGPLPQRHPDNCCAINGLETRTYKISLLPVAKVFDIDRIKKVVSLANVPTIDIDRLTLAKGESTKIKVFSKKSVQMVIINPDGSEQFLKLYKRADSYYTVFTPNEQEGIYKILVYSGDYLSEAIITVRKPWSFYLKQARMHALNTLQIPSSCPSSWYGLYSATIANLYFKDIALERATEQTFRGVYPTMYGPLTSISKMPEDSYENHCCMIGLLVLRFQYSNNRIELDCANHLANLLLVKQQENGAFYDQNKNEIYPVKSLIELLLAEKKFFETNSLTDFLRDLYSERYHRHFLAVKKSMDHLVLSYKRNPTTLSFKFGATSNCCLASLLAQFALLWSEDSIERANYTKSALDMLLRNLFYRQTQIPDSRMIGCTLYICEDSSQIPIVPTDATGIIASPHAKSVWYIYALFYLYELTLDKYLLRRAMNAMGACAQLLDLNGVLHSAFICEPYHKVKRLIKKQSDTVINERWSDCVVGEQYLDIISHSNEPDEETTLECSYYNGVHEVFRALGEVVLTKAYVVQNEDNTFECYNCSLTVNDDDIIVTVSEEIVSQVHINAKKTLHVTVQFGKYTKTQQVSNPLAGWIKK